MPVVPHGTGKRYLSRVQYLKLPADQEDIPPVMNLLRKNPFPIDFPFKRMFFLIY